MAEYKYTDEELLQIIKDKAKELGRTPGRREVSQCSAIKIRFGAWNDAIEKAGLRVTKRNSYKKEQLIEQIKYKAKILGRAPLKNDFTNPCTIVKYFGSVSNAIREADLIPFYKTDEELLKQLSDLGKSLGRTPNFYDLEANDMCKTTYSNRFRTWNNALKLAKLNIVIQPIKVEKTNDELIEDYINLCNRMGMLATSRDIDNDTSMHNINVYDTRFKGINNLRKIVLTDKRLKIKDVKYMNMPNKYSDEELKEFIKEIYIENGNKILTIEDLRKQLKIKKYPSINTFYKRFYVTKIKDLWDNAIKE